MTETSKHFLVECISEVNILIKKPLQQTLRIKFTTFDVSINYLVFGATSGGIYVFNRNKLDFLKLVPSKEGAILKLLICPEEKYVLVATSKGFIILVENCFTESTIRYQIFREHEGCTITDIIWHCNEIYCGDNKGKVSVISINSLLSKAIFQTPTAVLMHLDSTICQLDACGRLLLVSTKTKTFLCDTEAEQYRQIGKKLRDGDFGACFFAENPDWFAKNVDREKNRFRFVKDDESFPTSASLASSPAARIYCSRPGFRIWEANIDGTVICTYQFKSALQENVTESICLDSDANSRLKVRKMTLNHFENFGRLLMVQDQFLITYCKNNLVIFDKQGIHVVFVYEMRDITDVKIIHNYIYLWNKKDMRVIALMELEVLLLKVLSARQYLLCTELCLKHKDQVLQLIQTHDSMRSLHVLKDKCKQGEESKSLEVIFKSIERRLQNNETNSMPGSHIVTVENGHCEYAEPSCSYVNKAKSIRKSNTVHPTNIQLKPVEPTRDPHYINNILYKQYQVNQLYDNIETAQLHELLSSRDNLDEIVVLFEKFIEYVSDNALEKDNNNVRNWCYHQYLKFINQKRDRIESLDTDSRAMKTLSEALKSLSFYRNNKRDNGVKSLCDCGFPLPLADGMTDEYLPLARLVYSKLSTTDREQLLLQFPMLWKLKIDEMNDLPALVIQLSDPALFQEKSECFTPDNWNDCTVLLVKLKRGRCLNCDNIIDTRAAMTWKEFALIMLKRVGGLQTTRILKKHAKHIPNSELGYEFYQSCLFSAVSKENGKSCDFMSNVLTSTRLENQFEDGLRAYLNQKHLGKPNLSGMLDVMGTKCSVCNLLINNAILEGSTRLSCGHLFHKLCLESVSGICSVCMRVPN